MITLMEKDDMADITYGLFIATPCYKDIVTVPYMSSVLDLIKHLKAIGIPYIHYTISTDNLIPRARNMCVATFLTSKLSHMIFIDSDISFRYTDVITMLELDKDVLGGIYPKKRICWENIKQRAKGEGNGSDLEYACTLPSSSLRVEKSCIPVVEIGTGFLMIRRNVFTKMINAFPEIKYNTQYINEKLQNRNEFYAFFDTMINEEKIYVSEDFTFCHRCRQTGIPIYGFIEAPLTHIGTFDYEGDIMSQLSYT